MKKIWMTVLFVITFSVLGIVVYSSPESKSKIKTLNWEKIAPGIEYTSFDFIKFFRQGKIYAVKADNSRQLKLLVDKNKATTLKKLEELHKPVVIINGSYFQENYEPAGLLKISNKLYHELNKPGSSGILGINGKKVDIFHKSNIIKQQKKYHDLMQNGPLLVEEDGKMGIYSDDKAYTARTAICMTKDNKVIFIVANIGASPSLWELAQMLIKAENEGGFGCKVALNLDGGTSTGMRINIPGKKIIVDELVPVANAIGIF